MLVIELLVLAAIGAEGVYAVYRHYHKGRITKRLFSFWEAGQRLQLSVPVGNPGGDQDKAAETAAWNKKVTLWDNEVANFLGEKCSNQAVVSFRHHVVKPRLGTRITFASEPFYVSLEAELENLRSIMEKPDVYF
jgi:hypothetical protein